MVNTECSASTSYLEAIEQSDDIQGQSDSALAATGDLLGSGCPQNPSNLPNQDEIYSQGSDTTTITLSSPSQTVSIDSQDHSTPNLQEKECQTMDGVFLSAEEYALLLKKASFCPNFNEDLVKIRCHISHLTQPEMDPCAFENICKDAGAANLYSCINDAICSNRMSTERKQLSKLRTMVIIYIMVYSQSQRSNSFQVALSRTVQQFGITEQGLQSLRNLGIAAHPHTVKAQAKLSSLSHSNHVVSFVESAIEKNQFLIFCIDDYHNIHTKHRPESKKQTDAIHMSTLLLKVFPNIKAVPQERINLLPKVPVEIDNMKVFILNSMHKVTKTYAENMPNWVVAKYFDPEFERQRLVVHDYQQTELEQMRRMDNTKLVDSIELPLKSCEDVITALNKILSGGLKIYLDHFIAPFVGDWPMQFFIRRLVYSDSPSLPAALQNIVPLIGPLHISLNARECILLIYHEIFADLYTFLFGKQAKLAKKPKPWRVSLLLEIIYGGWTVVRDMILSVFGKCKDTEYLTLVNLLDSYVPLVLSIYSIVFKCNNYELYCESLLKCWIMFVVFRRRHYNKALLITLSLFQYWQENAHSMFDTVRKYLVAFDEYPVENFHSVLRARTKETDTPEQIAFKAKEIEACKHELHSFNSVFVPPRKFNYSSKKINTLKAKAAEFLTSKFESINNQSNVASQQPRVRGQPKYITKWKLPNLFADKIVNNRVLPLGYTSVEQAPNPNR